jgi:hypothetical protein
MGSKQAEALYDDESFRPPSQQDEVCLPEALHPTRWSEWCTERKATRIAMALCLCVPICPCRVVLHDHSGSQVVAGMFIGFLEGVGWWYVVKAYILQRMPPPGQFWCGCIEDNWPGSRIQDKAELRESLLAFDAYHEYEGGPAQQQQQRNLATQQMSFGHSSM